MAILAIDTAQSAGGLALVSDGRVLGEVLIDSPQTHSRRLLPAMEFLLAQCGLARHGLSGLAVSLGPGFFTGLRIGLASAQGLALALGLPVAGFSCLRLMAAGLAGARGVVWAVADARRGLVYAAPFRAGQDGLERLDADAAYSPARLAPLLTPPALLVGAGARLYAAELVRPGLELAPAWADTPRPGLLALLGQERLDQGQGLRPEELRPRYCRPSDAEVRFGLPLDGYRLIE
ncbi:MAG: tRNA (adenosine(37)-N6)-threonylcarbamoyltransferase complex dimerization subunit type 1 TsaB [Desulfarculus sp.]|nr:tRNA (adenosine(37)-N6)-threonylcarbamoyltransferase complex dimerization subunit type 1 TsaB [Desulfarculus sp.]